MFYWYFGCNPLLWLVCASWAPASCYQLPSSDHVSQHQQIHVEQMGLSLSLSLTGLCSGILQSLHHHPFSLNLTKTNEQEETEIYRLAGTPSLWCPSTSLSLDAVASESPDESSTFSYCISLSSRKLHTYTHTHTQWPHKKSHTHTHHIKTTHTHTHTHRVTSYKNHTHRHYNSKK